MAASEDKGKGDASYPYILSWESSDDEEIIVMDSIYKKPKLESESGKKINPPPLLIEKIPRMSSKLISLMCY